MATQAHKTSKVEFIVGAVSFLVICLTLLVAGIWLYRLSMDPEVTPITGFDIQGQIQYLQVDEIRTVLLQEDLGSFFTTDTHQLRGVIESLAWVQKAYVRKRWPGTLKVFIKEQRPMALWNGTHIVNEQGNVFVLSEQEMLALLLPELQGPEGEYGTAFTLYQQFQELLNSYDMAIQVLELTPRFAVNVLLESGITIRLGREERMQRLERFVQMLPVMTREGEKIDYVDLRYDTGVSVGYIKQDGQG